MATDWSRSPSSAAGAETWEVDTFLMSCRVLRRGVENAIVQCIADDAAEAGATLLAGDYQPTAKNSQVATFYPELGFTETGEGHFEAKLPTRPGTGARDD